MSTSLTLKADTACVPGGTLKGHIVLESDEAWNASTVDLVLEWQTRGKGSTNGAEVARQPLIASPQSIAAHGEVAFSIQLPPMPWTYYGKLVKIHWLLRLEARSQDGREATAIHGFVMHPDPASIQVDDVQWQTA